MANYSNLKGSGEVAVYADMNALIAATGMSDGDQAFVTATNNLYIYSTSGWYKIATVQNDSPSAITGVNGTYVLAPDGTATTITAVSTDPEGFALTWSYSTAGLGSIATVSQADNVFTITPSTNSANTGTFTLTINATDGVNGAVSTNTSLTLAFTTENSKYTTLLTTAVDTSDNNNITDSSSNNRTVTVTGNAHAGTFSPYRRGGYSAYFDGTSDYLNYPSSSEFAFGTGDFTVEAWVYVTQNFPSGSVSNDMSIFGGFYSPTTMFFHLNYSTLAPSLWDGSTSAVASSGFNTNEWAHVAWCRNNGNLKIFVNGVAGYDSSYTTDFSASVAPYTGMSNADPSRTFYGYISDLRVVKGTAVYTSDFTPPEERLTAITNTSLLTCHLPYFADGSTNDHAITSNGDVSIQPFAPYDYAPYSVTSHGGSYYFNSATDYFTVPDSADFRLGSADSWCWEGWAYRKQDGSREYIIGQQGSGYVYTNIVLLSSSDGSTLNANSMMVQVYNNGNKIVLLTPTNSVPKNTWIHFAVQYSSSSGWSIYLNGKSQTLTAHTGSASSTTYGWYTTSGNGSQGNLNIGYRDSGAGSAQTTVADIKWTPSIQYSSNFTPPTSSSSSTNALVHFKGTDASIIDKSQVANLELVGNTVGTTAQVKFAGSKSMAFDGTGDYIKVSSPVLDFGTGDFTIECWARTTNTVNNGVFTLSTSHFTQNNPRGIAVAFYTNFHNWMLYANGTTTNSARSHTPSTNTWYHIAVVRTGGYTKLYIDGTEIESRADTKDYSNHTALAIGGYYSGGYLLPGNIQDFRITKGLARYTANFTPPTETLQG